MRSRLTRAVVAVAVVLTAAPAAGAAGQTTLATIPAAVPVAASGTTVAWSTFDPATNAYALTVSIAGQTQTPPVATQQRPFDVDAGTGPDGSTWLVYSRCTVEPKGDRGWRGCSVYGYPLTGSATERRLTRGSEPAISGNRLVFARGRNVYVAPVTGSGRPARVHGAVPVRSCETTNDSCVGTSGLQVAGMDLHGKRLATVSAWDSTGPHAVGIGQTALILAPVAGAGKPEVIAFAVTGMNNQSLLGPSFAGSGALGWFYGCPGYENGCGGPLAGSWLYTLATGRHALDRSTNAVQAYAALPRNQAVEVLAGRGEQPCGIVGPSVTEPCSVVRITGLGYARTAAPREPALRLGR